MCVDLGTKEEITVFKIGEKFFSRHITLYDSDAHIFSLKRVSTIPAKAKSVTPTSKRFKVFLSGPDIAQVYYEIAGIKLKTNPNSKSLHDVTLQEFKNLGKKTFLFKKIVDTYYED
jgi:hypothetical protein